MEKDPELDRLSKEEALRLQELADRYMVEEPVNLLDKYRQEKQ